MALAPAHAGDPEAYRAELASYCRWKLGSAFDAEDAVQETLLRAWRRADSFDGRGSLKAWLYRIATNVCFDMLARRGRLPVPLDEGPETVSERREDDPVARCLLRDDRRVALIAAVQTLPPRQRAVLLLRDVLGWRAAEAADLLGLTVASLNSTLQRARASLADADLNQPPLIADAARRRLLARYAAAFDADDLDALQRLACTELRPLAAAAALP